MRSGNFTDEFKRDAVAQINGLFIIGMFLAVDLLVQGWSYTAFGLALRTRS